MQDSGTRYVIAGVALLILISAITWSKLQPSVGAMSGKQA
jgi:hypothetical protein